ncbi:MAG: acyltransferase, partial [Gammaproteobacteria bacterium]
KISYSLYVWHLAVVLPVFWFISAHPLVKGWAAVSGSILLASISFYAIERPVLRWSALKK